MKKRITILFSILTLCILTACGNDGTDRVTRISRGDGNESIQDEPSDEDKDNGKYGGSYEYVTTEIGEGISLVKYEQEEKLIRLYFTGVNGQLFAHVYESANSQIHDVFTDYYEDKGILEITTIRGDFSDIDHIVVENYENGIEIYLAQLGTKQFKYMLITMDEDYNHLYEGDIDYFCPDGVMPYDFLNNIVSGSPVLDSELSYDELYDELTSKPGTMCVFEKKSMDSPSEDEDEWVSSIFELSYDGKLTVTVNYSQSGECVKTFEESKNGYMLIYDIIAGMDSHNIADVNEHAWDNFQVEEYADDVYWTMSFEDVLKYEGVIDNPKVQTIASIMEQYEKKTLER